VVGEAVSAGGNHHGAGLPDPPAALTGLTIRLVRCDHIQPKPDPRGGIPLAEVWDGAWVW
jgi:hypothetical protein